MTALSVPWASFVFFLKIYSHYWNTKWGGGGLKLELFENWNYFSASRLHCWWFWCLCNVNCYNIRLNTGGFLSFDAVLVLMFKACICICLHFVFVLIALPFALKISFCVFNSRIIWESLVLRRVLFVLFTFLLSPAILWLFLQHQFLCFCVRSLPSNSSC